MSKYNPLEFERWRKLMVGGALVLLFVSILRAAGIIEHGPLYIVGLVAGYMLLAYGFAESFRARRKAKEEAAANPRPDDDPPVSGS